MTIQLGKPGGQLTESRTKEKEEKFSPHSEVPIWVN
jgi:hypothetical protein